MQLKELQEKIRETACRYIEEAGYVFVDMSLSALSGRLILRFSVDRPTGGISLEECALLNERLGQFFDSQGVVSESYVLEVSSPGIDRRLVNEKDFLRALNRKVRVFLNEPFNGKIEIEGIIDSVRDGYLFLNSGDRMEKIPMGKINRAKQVIE